MYVVGAGAGAGGGGGGKRCHVEGQPCVGVGGCRGVVVVVVGVGRGGGGCWE